LHEANLPQTAFSCKPKKAYIYVDTLSCFGYNVCNPNAEREHENNLEHPFDPGSCIDYRHHYHVYPQEHFNKSVTQMDEKDRDESA
jgi:hypothetical protein